LNFAKNINFKDAYLVFNFFSWLSKRLFWWGRMHVEPPGRVVLLV